MNYLSNVSALLLILVVSCKEKSETTLDGKSFQLSCWDVNQPDKKDPDLLVFKGGMMDSEACHQYGFTAAPYTSTVQNGILKFSGTISSNTEGTIVVEGIVRKENIEGTMLWSKSGQADIKYVFTGESKN